MGLNERLRLDGLYGAPPGAEPPTHDGPLPDEPTSWEAAWIDLGGEG